MFGEDRVGFGQLLGMADHLTFTTLAPTERQRLSKSDEDLSGASAQSS